MAALSIVIPTLGRSDSLPRVLSALAGQRPEPQGVEVLVVVDANGTAPGRLPMYELPPTVGLTVLRASHPGASAARNAGWQASQSPLMLFLDDDIVPTPGLLAQHIEWHTQHPDSVVGVLGHVRWSSDVRITPFMRWLELGIQFDYRTINSTEVGWQRFYSCNVSVKREMLERVRGFDEEMFPFGYEDLDLGRRLAQCGFRLLYNRAAVGEHLKAETLDSWRRNLRRIAVAEKRFTQRYPDAEPYFHGLFAAAAAAPAARGRAARLSRFVPRGVPWLGRRVWSSYDLVCRQRLAPDFLAAWNEADAVGQTAHARSQVAFRTP